MTVGLNNIMHNFFVQTVDIFQFASVNALHCSHNAYLGHMHQPITKRDYHTAWEIEKLAIMRQ